jgi:hypothetical protein
MRLYDPESDTSPPVPPGPLRIHVHGPDLRAHVVADVLRRVAERRRRPVLTGRSGPPPDRPLTDMNVLPMEWEPGAADLHVSDEAVPGRCLVVAPTSGSWADADPVTIRLTMLRTHYREPLAADASAAAAQLGRWRALVAEWANAPGRPLRADHVAAAAAAFDDDLDTPAVLAAMDRLAADPEIPPGAKFETFVDLDLILALDLVSAIGRSLPPVAPGDRPGMTARGDG